MKADPKQLAVTYIKAIKAVKDAEQQVERAQRELTRKEKEMLAADTALRELGKDGHINEHDIAVKDGDKAYVLNVMGHGISMKVLELAEILQPQSYKAEA